MSNAYTRCLKEFGLKSKSGRGSSFPAGAFLTYSSGTPLRQGFNLLGPQLPKWEARSSRCSELNLTLPYLIWTLGYHPFR